jgi:hypothetical protein
MQTEGQAHDINLQGMLSARLKRRLTFLDSFVMIAAKSNFSCPVANASTMKVSRIVCIVQ